MGCRSKLKKKIPTTSELGLSCLAQSVRRRETSVARLICGDFTENYRNYMENERPEALIDTVFPQFFKN